jgi:hypothetical protein
LPREILQESLFLLGFNLVKNLRDGDEIFGLVGGFASRSTRPACQFSLDLAYHLIPRTGAVG